MLKQVTLRVSGKNVFQELAQRRGCKLAIVDCKHSDSQKMSLLVEVEGIRGERDARDFLREIRLLPGIQRAYNASSSGSKMLIMLILESPLLCEASRCSNAFCESCPYNFAFPEEGEFIDWHFFVKDANDISKVMDLLEFRGTKAEVKKIEDAMREEDILTSRQKEVFSSALRVGYFDFPRRTSLTDLASELSIKPSTLSEILRNAESKIARAYAARMGISA